MSHFCKLLILGDLTTYVIETQKLKSNEKIKYPYFKNLLLRLFRSQMYPEDYKYDWVQIYHQQNQEYIRGLTMRKNGEVNGQN
jgi:hypothetical protein